LCLQLILFHCHDICNMFIVEAPGANVFQHSMNIKTAMARQLD